MPTLTELAEQHDAKFGDYDRLHFEGRTYTSFELSDMAKRCATGLLELGFQPGERVLVMLPNGPEVGTIYGATWRAGGVVMPVLFLLQPAEVAKIVREGEPAVAITSPEFLPVVQEAVARVPSVRRVVTTGQAGEGMVSFDDVLRHDPLLDPVPVEEEDLAALLFTGGTTGASKGVMLTHRNIAFDAEAGVAASNVRDDEIGLTSLPLAHGYGILVSAAGVYVKGFGVLLRWFEPTQFLEAVQTFRVNRAAVVPTMLQYLLQMPLEDYDLSSLESVTSGAAPLPMEVLRQWEQRTGSVVLEGYGCTENTAGMTVNRRDDRKPGSVGLPFPGVEVRVVDEQDLEVPRGEAGEVVCRGENVMKGYWRQPRETAAVLRDGWLHTGDIGRMDEDGFLYIVERMKDLIIRGGLNIYPRDVEDALTEHPGVSMAGVVGTPDEVYGEEAVAFVVRQPGTDVSEKDLLEFLVERIGKPKRPKEVRFVDAIPLTPVGKVNRKELRNQL
jgi:long-chain acyl-CoA synthetase